MRVNALTFKLFQDFIAIEEEEEEGFACGDRFRVEGRSGREETIRMGMEVPQSVAAEEDASNGVACRPGILVVGSKDVGKRTILNSAFFTYSFGFWSFSIAVDMHKQRHHLFFSFLFSSGFVPSCSSSACCF